MSKWLESTTEILQAFNKLNSKSVEPSMLVLLQPHELYMIYTDASAYASEPFFIQGQNDISLSESATIRYWSETRNLAKQNYSTTER